MLLFIVAVSFLLILSGAKSEDIDNKAVCKNDYRDMNNASIDITKYCRNKLCIAKCCGAGEILNIHNKCKNASTTKGYSRDNFTQIPVHLWDGSAKKSKKNLNDFLLVQNRRTTNPSCTYPLENKYFILEDGSVKAEKPNALERWTTVKQFEFCIDFKNFMINNNTDKVLKFAVKYSNGPAEDADEKSYFISIGMLISCFFLLMVLVVYYLLPQLRNVEGLVLMAYVWSLFITYLSRAILNLSYDFNSMDCKIITPFVYFATLSSFFWLTIMSFDLWWTLRSHRLEPEINRRVKLVKFLWYCLYAYGTPFLMTAGATILDNLDLTNWPNIIAPVFEDCLYNSGAVRIYTHIPIGILTFINIIMFFMTAYNVWKIKRGVTESQDFRRSKKDKYRFVIYLKLAVIMGIGWSLEVIPFGETSPILEYLLDLFNLLIGVAIFFLLVFKKRILLMLCKRFDIQNGFVQKLQPSKSGTTRMKRLSSTFKSSKSQARDNRASKTNP